VTTRTLGDYFDLQRGTTYKSKLLGQPGPVLLGLASIQRNGGFRTDSLKTYGGESPDKLLVAPGQLYVSLKDVTQSADLLGAVARLPALHPPGRLTQDTVKLVAKNSGAPISYLYWLMRTPQYRGYCRAHATGTTNLGLAREDFLAFPVPEPTPSRLQAVETLDALDDKIELNRRMNQTLEEMARAIFKSWFVDFDPVRAKAEGRQPAGMDAATAALFPDSFEDSELGKIPKGWQVRPVRDVSEGVFDGPHATPPRSETGRVFLGIKNFTPTHLDLTSTRLINDADWKRWTKRVTPQGGDIVFTYEATLGYFAIIPDWLTCCLGRRTALVRPKVDGSGLFLFHQFIGLPFQDLLRERTNPGSTVDRILLSEFPEYPVLWPTEKLIAAFCRIAGPMWRRFHSNMREGESLAALRDAMLPKLLSGELRTTDASNPTEAVT
jgi:type I restriction enzyme S subunit